VICKNVECEYNRRWGLDRTCGIEPEISKDGKCVSDTPKKDMIKKRKELFNIE